MKSHRVTLKITHTKKNRSILSYLAKKNQPKMTPELVKIDTYTSSLYQKIIIIKIKKILIIHQKKGIPHKYVLQKKTQCFTFE